ncbi:hypothetical protein HMPREF9499_02083 [Enterococcus faecalis TX0012]|nr:hypothetical protein HMPREF9499_02083 [Enterococcus faecalis TX0012]
MFSFIFPYFIFYGTIILGISLYTLLLPFANTKKGECVMTFTNKNKNFDYKVTLNTTLNIFVVFLTTDQNICATGLTIEQAVNELEKKV